MAGPCLPNSMGRGCILARVPMCPACTMFKSIFNGGVNHCNSILFLFVPTNKPKYTNIASFLSAEYINLTQLENSNRAHGSSDTHREGKRDMRGWKPMASGPDKGTLCGKSMFGQLISCIESTCFQGTEM